MPVACSTSALSGSDGSVYFTPAGTKFCLEDYEDFPAGTVITVPATHDFRVGDPVVFTEEDGGNIDSALTAGDQYYVVATTATTISVSSTKGGTEITLNGDGGTSTANSAGHIKVEYDPFGAICNIKEWSISIERETLDTTTLPCGVSASSGGGKYAAFRSTQPGYASGTGEMTVLFSDNDLALGTRLLDNIMLSSQEGARVRLFLNTVSDGDATNPQPDLSASMYIEADISLTGMDTSVNPDDPTEATVSFSVNNPKHLFKTAIG